MLQLCKMDDFKLENLSEAKNEYSARLVNILSPLVIEGLKSLFDEANDLCIKNGEHSKYLMTFQNFLARVPKWNATIIDDETKRIITKSECSYLEDLITCVHIAQLKILTSIRVGQKQKKIELDIPKINDFIHKIYIQVARKIYTNVYLFEENIMPLNYQKNMRECELIVKECILNVIRDSIPVEHILRSYIDESIEEDVEVKEEIIETEPAPEAETEPAPESEPGTEPAIKAESEEKGDIKETTSETTADTTPDTKTETSTENTDESLQETTTEPTSIEESNKNENISLRIDTSEKENELETTSSTLSFNDVDRVLDMGTNEENKIEAPKTIERLEQISEDNYQRRLEEEEEEEEEGDILTIGPSIHLDTLDIHNVNQELKLSNKPLLTDVEVLN